MRSDAFSKCHPLVNFIFFLGAIGFGVVIRHPAYIALGLLCAGCYGCLLEPAKALKALAALLPLMLLVAVINPLFNYDGQIVLLYLFGKPYTLEALLYGAALGGILGVMLLWFLCYSAVLTSDKFICLFGSRIPSLSLLLTMVLRLIPDLVRKAGQIFAGRKSIGKAGTTKKERLLGGMAVISALTDRALEGGIVTADSMRARGYGCARRTSFQIYRFTLRDGVLLGLMAVLAALVLGLGGTEAVYTPAISIAPPGLGLAAYGAFLLIPTILHGKEALAWRISRSSI